MSADEPYEIRIIGLTLEDPESLLAHPQNPKIHPKAQSDALDAAMREVGILAPAIVNDRTQHCLDGHDRIGLWIANGQRKVPVLHVDVPEAKEGTVLATFDPIGAMAVLDQPVLDQLLDEIGQVQDEVLARFLASQRSNAVPFDPSAEWAGMPEFVQDDQGAVFQAHINFASMDDLAAFEHLLGYSIPRNTKSVWYPPVDRADFKSQGYVSDAT